MRHLTIGLLISLTIALLAAITPATAQTRQISTTSPVFATAAPLASTASPVPTTAVSTSTRPPNTTTSCTGIAPEGSSPAVAAQPLSAENPQGVPARAAVIVSCSLTIRVGTSIVP